ncbi:MAG: membrane protease YdiL (CAAX protease family), partial [Patiriisocius sp.]
MTRSRESIWIQILLGIVVGGIAGFMAWFISESKWVSPRSGRYLNLIGEMNLRHVDIIFISLCAGIGEELLFRGAIQPFLGIWITAVVFVLIHGYINPKDWRISIYGVSMTVIIAVLGFMCDRIGIWSAAIAHAMIDYVLLQLMVKKWSIRKSELLNLSIKDIEE